MTRDQLLMGNRAARGFGNADIQHTLLDGGFVENTALGFPLELEVAIRSWGQEIEQAGEVIARVIAQGHDAVVASIGPAWHVDRGMISSLVCRAERTGGAIRLPNEGP